MWYYYITHSLCRPSVFQLHDAHDRKDTKYKHRKLDKSLSSTRYVFQWSNIVKYFMTMWKGPNATNILSYLVMIMCLITGELAYQWLSLSELQSVTDHIVMPHAGIFWEFLRRLILFVVCFFYPRASLSAMSLCLQWSKSFTPST